MTQSPFSSTPQGDKDNSSGAPHGGSAKGAPTISSSGNVKKDSWHGNHLALLSGLQAHTSKGTPRPVGDDMKALKRRHAPQGQHPNQPQSIGAHPDRTPDRRWISTGASCAVRCARPPHRPAGSPVTFRRLEATRHKPSEPKSNKGGVRYRLSLATNSVLALDRFGLVRCEKIAGERPREGLVHVVVELVLSETQVVPCLVPVPGCSALNGIADPFGQVRNRLEPSRRRERTVPGRLKLTHERAPDARRTPRDQDHLLLERCHSWFPRDYL